MAKEEEEKGELYSRVEELYFWLMRSATEPKSLSGTFQILSQIMRIAKALNTDPATLSKTIEKEAFAALSHIKEQLQDGQIQIYQIFDAVKQVLQKLIRENPKAQLIAHATEIEYIFCSHSQTNSAQLPGYQQRFQGYLKNLVTAVSHSISESQARAIVRIMSQIVRNPTNFASDPHKNLSESLKSFGVTVLENTSLEPTEKTSQSA